MKDMHMRTITHLIAGGIAATALVAGTAVTASAQSTTIKDKRADVVQYDGYADFEEKSGVILNRAASIATGVDATSATVKYGKKSLKVTMRFAELGKLPIQIYGRIRVKGAKSWPSYWFDNEGSNKRVTVFDRKGTREVCKGKLTRKNGDKGTLSFTIANSCFKKPKKIKVDVGLFGFAGNLGGDDVTIYDESISSSKVKTTSFTKWLKSN